MAEYRRQFKVTAIKADDSTGIGITEYSYPTHDTTLIHSLYYDTRLSNRDIIVEACKVVSGYLDNGEYARIRTGGVHTRETWVKPYNPRVILKGHRYDERYKENKRLAEDALDRGTTIYEEMES